MDTKSQVLLLHHFLDRQRIPETYFATNSNNETSLGSFTVSSHCKDEQKYIDRTQDEPTAKQSEYHLPGMACEFDWEELQEDNALGQRSPSSIGLLELESHNLEATYCEEPSELTVTSYHWSQHDDINISKDESAQIVRERDDEEHQNNITSSQETSPTIGSSVQPSYAPQYDEEINEDVHVH